jgi:hypothetical protein
MNGGQRRFPGRSGPFLIMALQQDAAPHVLTWR